LMWFEDASLSFERLCLLDRLPEMRPYKCLSENAVPKDSKYRIPSFRRIPPPSSSHHIGEVSRRLPENRLLGAKQIASYTCRLPSLSSIQATVGRRRQTIPQPRRANRKSASTPSSRHHSCQPSCGTRDPHLRQWKPWSGRRRP